VFRFHQVTPQLLEAHCRSRSEALALMGYSALVDALLPEEFLREFAPKVESAPDWLGFWVLQDDLVIGSGGYRGAPVDGIVEIGYGIHEDYWGQGAATALCGSLVSHAYASGATGVRAHTLRDGFASQSVLKKNGFGFVGEFEEPDDGLVLRWEIDSCLESVEHRLGGAHGQKRLCPHEGNVHGNRAYVHVDSRFLTVH
jgi:[ribosomal protein S5]-alanine N-acetyltransferase